MYTRDVCSRLAQHIRIWANIKIDSTKKIYRKLAGDAAGTATWQTNVGNEVLILVVTDSRALVSLQQMADEEVMMTYELSVIVKM